MDLIKLLDIANPKTIKDTINAMIGITNTANTNASNAVTTANEAKTLSQTAATNSASARQTAEEALAIIEEADARSEEASLLAEQAIADADDAVDTAELALNTANAARSAVDQALDLGQLGSFVHNTSGIALAHAYMTDSVNQTDDAVLDRYYVATPKLVRDVLASYYTKTEVDIALNNKVNSSTLASYYTKTEMDTALSNKADASELNNYVTKGTAQEISGIKTFTNSVNFGNGVWNALGDDVKFGDSNSSGAFTILGLNGTTRFKFIQYTDNTKIGYLSFNDAKFTFDKSLSVNGRFRATILNVNNRTLTTGAQPASATFNPHDCSFVCFCTRNNNEEWCNEMFPAAMLFDEAQHNYNVGASGIKIFANNSSASDTKGIVFRVTYVSADQLRIDFVTNYMIAYARVELVY